MSNPLSWISTGDASNLNHSLSSPSHSIDGGNTEPNFPGGDPIVADIDGAYVAEGDGLVDIPSFNFDWSAQQKVPSLETSIATKQFLIKRKNDRQETTITFAKKFVSSIFDKIASKFGIKKKEEIVLCYPLRESSGKIRKIAVVHDTLLEESLTAFYTQAEEMSLLIVEQIKQVGRDKRPCEHIYSQIISKSFTVDRKFYEFLIKHTEICAKFQRRREYISLLLGNKCLNLLNPAHYICHIIGCEKVLLLGSFSKLTLIFQHWKEHAASDISGEGPCMDLIRRHHFVSTIKNGESWIGRRDIPGRSIKSLETGGSFSVEEITGSPQDLVADESELGDSPVMKKKLTKVVLSSDSDNDD